LSQRYVVHGDFPKGTVATSHLLPGFTVDVAELLAHPAVVAKLSRKPRRSPRRGSWSALRYPRLAPICFLPISPIT